MHYLGHKVCEPKTVNAMPELKQLINEAPSRRQGQINGKERELGRTLLRSIRTFKDHRLLLSGVQINNLRLKYELFC